MKLKGLHFVEVVGIQEAVTDELKKVWKVEFSAAFQKLYDRAKACIYANGAYFELKKVCLFNFKKKSVLKLLDHTVYAHNLILMLRYKSDLHYNYYSEIIKITVL
jgi:hypothetical protein